jgi:ElaB/YqjD/DUF883 family membrane-anchored ribosome-binding protein
VVAKNASVRKKIMEDNGNGKVKTDVELLKRDMELLANLAGKFDVAIDKLTDVSQSVDKMLALHEQRIENQEQQREILHNRISDFKKEVTDNIRDLRDENRVQHNRVEERLDRLEKWRWFVVGVATMFGFILAQIPNISKIFQ